MPRSDYALRGLSTAAVLMLLAVVVRGTAQPVDAGLEIGSTASGPSITSVAPWSWAWTAGITPETAVIAVNAGPDGWTSAVLSESSTFVAVQRHMLSPGDATLLVLAVAGILVALIAWRAQVFSWAGLILASLDLGVLAMPSLPAPAAAAGWGLGPLVAALAAAEGQRPAVRVAVVALAAAIAGGSAVALSTGLAAWPQGQYIAPIASAAIAGPTLLHRAARWLRSVHATFVRNRALGAPLPQAALAVAFPGHAAALAARYEEQARLADALHAEVIPALVSALRAAEQRADDDVVTQLLAASGEVRSLMDERRPIALEALGLAAALGDLGAKPGVAVSVVEDGGSPPEEICRVAYEVAREAVENSRRHGAATRITLTAHLAPRELDLMVEDDGREGDRAAPLFEARPGHLGLAGLRLRSVAIHADLDATLSASGAIVRFRWPT